LKGFDPAFHTVKGKTNLDRVIINTFSRHKIDGAGARFWILFWGWFRLVAKPFSALCCRHITFTSFARMKGKIPERTGTKQDKCAAYVREMGRFRCCF
jgi:hypothetical protein